MSEKEFLVNIIKILFWNTILYTVHTVVYFFPSGPVCDLFADIVKSIKTIRNSFIPLECGRMLCP